MRRLAAFLKGISADCYMVCLYFICLPFTVVPTPFGSLLKIVTLPVVAVLGFTLFVGKERRLSFNSIHLMYSLYIAYVVFGLFILRNDLATTLVQDMLLTYAVLMLITMRVYTEDERKMIESTWIAVGIICVYLALSSNEMVNEFENRIVVSVFGHAEDPNQFCAYFIMPMVVSVKRIVEKSKKTPIYILLILLMFYSVMRTGSRGGMIGLLIGIIMCMFFAVKSLKAKLGMTAVAIICALVVIFVIFPLLPEDIQNRYDISSVVEDNAAGRFDIWAFLMDYIFEKPSRIIYGSGLFSTYDILELADLETGSGVAHNQFIQVLNDQGIIGLAMFSLIILSCFFRNVKKQPYYACAFVAIMSFSMSLTMYVFKPYINIIMMCALTFIKNEETRGVKNEIPSGADRKV